MSEFNMFDFYYLEKFSDTSSPIHAMNPKIKFLLVIFFIIIVSSFSKFSFAQMLPLLLFPIYLMQKSGFSPNYLLIKLILFSPFILGIALFEPILIDTKITFFNHVTLSWGWISFAGIMLKYCLCMSAAMLFIGTTKFVDFCRSLRAMHFPVILVQQIFFMYRFIFIISNEFKQVLLARELRNFKGKKLTITTAMYVLNQILHRSLLRTERVHNAMCSRNFTGFFSYNIYPKANKHDFIQAIIWLGFIILVRLFSLSDFVGRLLML